MIAVVATAFLLADLCRASPGPARTLHEACLADAEDWQEPELGASLMQVTQAFVQGRAQAVRQVGPPRQGRAGLDVEEDRADSAWCQEMLIGMTPVPAWPMRLQGNCQAVFADAGACRAAAGLVLDEQSSFPQALEEACGVLGAAARSKRQGKQEKEEEEEEQEASRQLKRRKASQAGVRSSVEFALVSKGHRVLLPGPPYPNLTCIPNITNVTNNQTGVANVTMVVPNTTIDDRCWIYEDAQDTSTSTTTTTVTTTTVTNASNASGSSNSSSGGNGTFL